ncbi:ankyrin repeat domain-containing protein [Desulfovibrio sp. OttesenSCG-928-I05]|nr:ankyrin repeat domain-containing protein [Desulfovibrio sp. OttesenSCG-928-I05]
MNTDATPKKSMVKRVILPICLLVAAGLIAAAILCWPHRERLAEWQSGKGLVAAASTSLDEYFPELHSGDVTPAYFLGLCRFGTAEQVAEALKKNPAVEKEARDYLEKTGQGTIFHRLALGAKDLRIVHILLFDTSVPLTATDKEGRTALHVAAEFCPDPALAYLLNARADADRSLRDARGRTPLQVLLATGGNMPGDPDEKERRALEEKRERVAQLHGQELVPTTLAAMRYLDYLDDSIARLAAIGVEAPFPELEYFHGGTAMTRSEMHSVIPAPGKGAFLAKLRMFLPDTGKGELEAFSRLVGETRWSNTLENRLYWNARIRNATTGGNEGEGDAFSLALAVMRALDPLPEAERALAGNTNAPGGPVLEKTLLALLFEMPGNDRTKTSLAALMTRAGFDLERDAKGRSPLLDILAAPVPADSVRTPYAAALAMLDMGADGTVLDNDGKSALDCMLMNPSLPGLLLRTVEGYDYPEDIQERFLTLLERLSAMKSVAFPGLDSEAGKDSRLHTLLALPFPREKEAARYLLLRTLLEGGSDANVRAAGGMTPLQRTLGMADGGTPEQIVLLGVLLEHKADPNLADAAGMTPLMHAATRDNAPAVYMLMDAGAAMDAVDAEGKTALHHAAASGAGRAAEALLKAGANPSMQDAAGKIPHALCPDTEHGGPLRELLKPGQR